jgi:hypothetical protein
MVFERDKLQFSPPQALELHPVSADGVHERVVQTSAPFKAEVVIDCNRSPGDAQRVEGLAISRNKTPRTAMAF